MGIFLVLAKLFCVFLCYLDSGEAQAPSVECRFTRPGTSYTGTVSTTRSGRTCQAWTLQSPHQHGYMDAVYFPDEHMANVSNYCRNPNKDFDGVWCFTTDPNVLKEYCDIPICDCKTTTGGHEYLGTRSVTRSGKTCQRWDAQTPHSHGYNHGWYFPDSNVTLAGNHCRNPDSGWNSGPWCYTTDENTRWETCDVPLCDCVPEISSYYYMGQLSVTLSGYTCQRWDSQTPHGHHYTYDSYFPDGSVTAANNHCRDPDLSKPGGPWCYTTEPDVEWEYCHVPDCQYEPPPLTTTTSTKGSSTRLSTVAPSIAQPTSTMATASVRSTGVTSTVRTSQETPWVAVSQTTKKANSTITSTKVKDEKSTACSNCKPAGKAENVGGRGLSRGAYIGIGVAAFVLLLALLVAVVLVVRYRRKDPGKSREESGLDNPMYYDSNSMSVTVRPTT